MKCGKIDLCEVEQIKGKYAVTWNKHITGLSVYDQKVSILFDMIVKDSKSFEIGIMLSTGHVLWISSATLLTLTMQDLVDYVIRCGSVQSPREIEGVIFDNIVDVETFANRLEQKYIVHVLKA